ncbi:MAG: efflux RND transporter periplasmic adaptor subunit [bacterium]
MIIKSNVKRIAIVGTIVAMLLMVLGNLLWERGRRGAPKPVRISEATSGDLITSVSATGTIVPRERADVMAPISGIVEEVYFEEGDQVRKGDVLIRLDDDNLRVQKAQAEANLALAERQVAQSLIKARAAHEDARRAYERIQALYRDGIASLEEWQTVQNRYRLAREELNLIEGRPIDDDRKSPPRADADIIHNSPQVAQARSALESVLAQLEDSIIRAPISGTVVLRTINVGAAVAPGTPLMAIADVEHLEAEANVDEVDIGEVKMGQETVVRSDAFIGVELPGRVTKIAPQAQRVGNINAVRISSSIDRNDGRLRAGVTCTVKIITNRRKNTLQVPLEAIFEEDLKKPGEGGEKKFVFVIKGGGKNEAPRSDKESGTPGGKKRARIAAIEKREVKTGLSNVNNIEILEGLREGEEVVVSEKKNLKSGDRVKVEVE